MLIPFSPQSAECRYPLPTDVPHQAFTETQSFGGVHPGQASLVRPGSLSDTHARGSAGCGRSKTYSESPGDTDADQWGLWNESSLEEDDSRNPRGLTDGSQHHLPRDARSAPNLTAGGVVSESQNDRRPRTSPDQGSGHVSTRNGSGDRRAPKRIHSKWLMQSAMDVSLGDWTDGEMLSPGSSIFGDSWREQSAYSAPSKRYHLDTTHRPTTSPSRIGGTVQHGGAKSEHYYGVMTTTVDNTGNSVGAWSGHPGCVHLPQPRLSGAQHLEQSCGGAMKLHSSSCQHRSGFSDTTGLTVQVPTPKVWGSKQMIAAVAAATEGHPASSRERAATKGGKLIWLSEGGVVQVEDRLSKARSTLRGDLFDAAERAALPLLQ